MEQTEQPRLNLPVEEKTEKLPFSLKAKIIAFQKGIPYREAYGLMLDQEVRDRAEERKGDHAP
ncbi:MAG: hypothetical protein WAV56_00975 [Microgenomates group bacterium]